MPPGYVGQILYADLTDLSTRIVTKDEYFYRTFMGGSAMASYFLLTEIQSGIDALSPDNVLVVTTSILTGGSFDKVESVTFQRLTDTVLSGRDTCHACPIRCKQEAAGGKFDIDPSFGGPEYETSGAFGPNMLVDDIEVIAKAHEMCNRYSLDTIDAGMSIAFAMECFENGLISAEDTDGLDLRFGNGEAALEMVHKIALRQGFGDLLAEGAWRASQKIGKGSEKYAMTMKKQAFAMHEPRGKNNIAMAYAVSPTGADHIEAAHDMPFEEGRWAVPDLFPIGILKGVPARGLSPYKIRSFVYNQHIYSLLNSLSMCFFTAGPARLFRLNHIVDMVAAATGWETSLFELMQVGERTTTLARTFLTREGLDRKDDELPDRMYEPLDSGILKGTALDRQEMSAALDMYYEMMGWDVATGVPRPVRLYQLNIAELDQF
jgi:aldehyde:ferredoxin oxidoreductase